MFDWAENLDDAVKTSTPIRDDIDIETILLKPCLDLDPKRRVTPREAFKNPFLSMGHLADVMDFSMYADEALEFMTVSPLNHLSESDYFLSDTDMDLSEGDGLAAEYEDDKEDSVTMWCPPLLHITEQLLLEIPY
ncbi:hypothetical protein GBF38_011459 [Nibea albiflora]|uniref:Uncharacterized protein n=1 Tax=Nibea albiflora TaxID=240163 RepID=A0ACB7F445_NIBAL|nr:hypothetical protein GBF38_011459 [Nibea albiflora]